MSDSFDQDAFFQQMMANIPEGLPVEIPPKVFTDAEGEILSVDLDAKRMRVRYPVKERYLNPLRYVQGGIIVALIDNTIGPLSYLVAPPSVTTHLNTTYIRPATGDLPHIEIDAWVTDQTRRLIYLAATAYNPAGKTLVTAQSTQMIIS